MRWMSMFLVLALLLTAGVPAGAAEAEGPPAPEEAFLKAEAGTPEAPEVPENFTIKLTFAGDCLLSTYMGQMYKGSFSWYAANKEPSYFLEKVADVFREDDFTIVNLETVLTDRKLKEVEKASTPAYWFRGPTSNAAILSGSGVEAVSLANNHTGDYGAAGRKDTAAAVEAAGLLYGANDKTFFLEKNGFKIAVICHGLWNEGQASQIISRLKKASELSDYQIVFFHGGREGVHSPEAWKVRACRKLADAGADLVIGAHPHVLQPAEVYKGVHIVYSLGNFCYGGSRKPENRTLIYQMTLTINDGTAAVQEPSFIPCYVYTGSTNNWQPAPLTDEAAKQKVLDFMAWQRSLPY